MADRYWVGGTASWDGTAGSKWATTDGGAGGSAIPNSFADDVFLTAKPAPTWVASTVYALAAIVSPVTGNGYFYECTTAGTTAGTEPTWPTVVGNTVTDGTVVWTCRACTVTIASGNSGAKTIDCTGFTGTVAGTINFTVRGNVTLVSGMTWTHTGTMSFQTTSATLITAGRTFSGVEVNTAGITLTLGDALTSSSNINVTQGTFNTANYNVTALALLSSNSNTRTITLGSSTVTLTGSGSGISFTTSTNLTFNAGTSQITLSGGGASLAGGNQTFYNVSFTNTSANTASISGTNTFNNLTITAPTAASNGIRVVNIFNNQTINGTLTASNTTALRRVSFFSSTIRTTRTLTVANFAPSDCDFRDIIIAGGASPVSGTRLGNCGNNSNITFNAPKTVYWNPAGQSVFMSASWATDSGSTTLSADNFPLAQDIAVIDDNSRAGMSTPTPDMNIGELDMSNRTTAFASWIFTFGFNLYKNLKVGTGVTFSGGGTATLCGTSTQTITSNGRTITGGITINCPNNTVELADAINCGGNITLTAGTFDAKTYNVTTTNFLMSGSTTRSLKMGSGTWTLTSSSGTLWSATSTTGLTFDKGTADIVFSFSASQPRAFNGGDLTYNKFTIGGALGSSTTTIAGSNTFSELASIKTVAHTITFAAGTTTTVGAWTITGTPGNVVTLQSSSTSNYTLNKTGGGTVSCDYMSISRSTATPANTWYAEVNSTNGGNNSGWTFAGSSIPSSSGTFLFLFT